MYIEGPGNRKHSHHRDTGGGINHHIRWIKSYRHKVLFRNVYDQIPQSTTKTRKYIGNAIALSFLSQFFQTIYYGPWIKRYIEPTSKTCGKGPQERSETIYIDTAFV